MKGKSNICPVMVERNSLDAGVTVEMACERANVVVFAKASPKDNVDEAQLRQWLKAGILSLEEDA